MEQLQKKALFNENGDIEVTKRRMINGNTTNLNDFNNMKYSWVSQWYRQAMNNFWIPEEINLSQDVKDYRSLKPAEKTAYDKILSFWSSWTPYRQQTFPMLVNTSRPMKSICACLFNSFRKPCILRAIPIC